VVIGWLAGATPVPPGRLGRPTAAAREKSDVKSGPCRGVGPAVFPPSARPMRCLVPNLAQRQVPGPAHRRRAVGASAARHGAGRRRAPPLSVSLGGGRREFTDGGASLLHGERTGTRRTLRITRIDNGDVLCPKIGGVVYGAAERPHAEGTVSSNGPPRVKPPIYYPLRYSVLDVDVDDHARRETRAQDVERGH